MIKGKSTNLGCQIAQEHLKSQQLDQGKDTEDIEHAQKATSLRAHLTHHGLQQEEIERAPRGDRLKDIVILNKERRI